METQVKRGTEQFPKVAPASDYRERDEKLRKLESAANELNIVDFPRLQTDVESYSDYMRSAIPILSKIKTRPLATMKTDADGKFTVTVRRGHNLAAVATAERYVGEGTERYFWAVNVGSERVVLSNDNEVSAPHGDSLLHSSALTQGVWSHPQTRAELEARFTTLTTKAESVFREAASIAKERALPAPAQRTSSQQSITDFVTLIRPIEVAIAYGKTKLPAGTRLKVISRSANSINAAYLGNTIAIPVDAVVPK